MIIEKIKKTVRETHAPICKRDLLWISLLLLKEKETLNQRGRWRFFFFYFRLTVTALTVFQPFFSCLRLLPLLKILFSSKSNVIFLIWKFFLRREKMFENFDFFLTDEIIFHLLGFFGWLTLELFNSPVFFWPCPSGLTPPFSLSLFICASLNSHIMSLGKEKKKRNR